MSSEVEKEPISDPSTDLQWQDFVKWDEESHFVRFNTIYVDMAGDVVSGLMLSQIVYWHLPSNNRPTKLRVYRNGRLWLAKSWKDWYEECRLSRKQSNRAIKALECRKLIDVELFRFNWHPTKHVSINREVFLREWAVHARSEWSFDTYEGYLESEEWKGLRQDALKRAGYRCQLCNKSGQMNVHHRSYEHRGVKSIANLIVLCRECHAKHHDKAVR